MSERLEQLYQEARSALKARDYIRTGEVLRQILQIDENYKDASRLLAQMVKLRRQRWYNHPALWSVVGAAVVIGLGIWLAPKISLPTDQLPTPTVISPTITSSPTVLRVTATATATETPLPTPTAVPLKWKRISLGQDFARDEIAIIYPDPNDKDLLFIKTKHAGDYMSFNGGISWQPTTEGIRYPPETKNNPELRVQWQCAVLVTDPNDNRIAYCGIEKGIYRTSDMGRNWQLSNPKVGWVKFIAISPHDPKVIFAGGRGLSISTDGGQNWEVFNNGLPSVPMELTISPQDSSVLFIQEDYAMGGAASGYPVYRSADKGESWKQVIEENCELMFDPYGNPVCGGVSLDNGKTWRKVYNGGPLKYDETYGFAVVGSNFPRSPTAIIKKQNFNKSDLSFSISQDQGRTWHKIQTLDTDRYDSRIRFFFDHQQGQIIYSFALEGGEANPLLHRSDDYGETWNRCSSPDVSSPDTNTRLAVDYNDSSRIYLATRGSVVLVSHDGCKSWTSTMIGYQIQSINSIVLDPKRADTIIAGTNNGAYISFDGGQAWDEINDGLLGATVVYSIAVDKDGNIYAATPYGIFQLEKK